MYTSLERIRSLGGIAATHELLAGGATPRGLASAVRSGFILRVRQGWYADPDTPQSVLRAWRVGGRLGCVSAAADHGLWDAHPAQLHVAMRHNANGLRTPEHEGRRLPAGLDRNVVVHWKIGARSGTRRAVSVADALVQVVRCQPARLAFVVLESALRGPLDTLELARIIDVLPTRFRRHAERAETTSDSGAESMLKWELLRLRIPFRQQVRIADIGPVDFLIGERLVIEVDSLAFHSDPYRDRRKDAALGSEGYRVLRFMFSQIVYEWPAVETAIIAALGRGDHRD